MENLLSRYRNLTILVVVIAVQLVLLAYQIRGDKEVRLIRLWAVTAVTPVARMLESVRDVGGSVKKYFVLLDVREENDRLRDELERARLENYFLRAELDTADRAAALAIFQERSPMKTVAAQIITNTTESNDQVVIVDRGADSGIRKGMGVITPYGIVGKVVDVFPNASFVLLATDRSFAAGVISQTSKVHGTLKGQGTSAVRVDYVQNELEVAQGEWFYTSGDDRIFPRGLPAGVVTAVRPGREEKEIILSASGFENGLEEVLIVVEGVHAEIPLEAPVSSLSQPVLLEPPAAEQQPLMTPAQSGPLSTDADRIFERIRRIGEVQNHVFGERGAGAPDFNVNPDAIRAVPAVVPRDVPMPNAPANQDQPANSTAPPPASSATPEAPTGPEQ